MKVILIERSGKRFVERYRGNKAAGEQERGELIAELEPVEPLQFYSWDNNGAIFFDAAKKQRFVKAGQIQQLKRRLEALDYKTSKYADGEYTETEWAEIVSMRRAVRADIRALEE